MNSKSVDGEVTSRAESLFINDTGELTLDARRALILLLSGPSLDARKHSKLWPVLLQHEKILCSRLSDLFLELVIDRDLEVAFTRQAEVGELDVPVLLRRAPLTFTDSVLLLFLRQQLARFEGRGERAAVSLEEIIEHLKVYGRQDQTDHALLNKKATGAIEKMKNYSILRKIRGSEERLEISPTLKLLFSGEEVQKLIAAYAGAAENPNPEVSADLDDDIGSEEV